MTPTPPPAVAVIIVCHNNADCIESTLARLVPQLAAGDELVVVDNASTDGTAERIGTAHPEARVLATGENLGFAGGAVLGARSSSAPLLLFLNPDCAPAQGFLPALRQCATARPSWGAWQALVTMDGGRQVNTAGNTVHFLGISWAGGLGAPVSSVPPRPEEVPYASGAALMVRREAWDAVGGFDERYFMYVEDLDLSLRLRLAGWEIGVVPEARADHDYEFTKGDYKWRYLERNRWWTVLSDYPTALLVLVMPALAAFELGLLLVAARGGWLRPKLEANAAVIRELPAILARRRAVQARRRISTSAFADILTSELDSPALGAEARLPGLQLLLAAYLRGAREVLTLGRLRPGRRRPASR